MKIPFTIHSCEWGSHRTCNRSSKHGSDLCYPGLQHAKHHCRTIFQSDVIWSHKSFCIRYAPLASSQIPGEFKTQFIAFKWLYKALIKLYRRNEHPVKKQDMQDTFGKYVFVAIGPLASDGLIVRWNKVMWWNWRLMSWFSLTLSISLHLRRNVMNYCKGLCNVISTVCGAI